MRRVRLNHAVTEIPPNSYLELVQNEKYIGDPRDQYIASSALMPVLTGTGVPTNFVAAIAAALVVDSIPANSDLTFTAVTPGVAGNLLTVAILQPVTLDEELTITFDGTDAVINLPTDGAGDPVAVTAAELKIAWDAEAVVGTITVVAQGTGAGAIGAAAEASLANGAETVLGTGNGIARKGTIYSETTTPALYVNTGTLTAPVWTAV